MALRDQPYIPLYVQDFLTDEKLIECSASATGVYIRLLCIMHKSDKYGTILLKQKDQQSKSTCYNFAYKLAKQMPYDVLEIENGLLELIDEGVIQQEDDKLLQKRMIHDNNISLIRADAGSRGGFATANNTAKDTANSEYETETVNVIKKKEKKKVFDFSFVWNQYPKKIGKSEALGYFNMTVRTDEDFANINVAIANYMRHIEDNGTNKQYIKAGCNWFKDWESWVDYEEPITGKDKEDAIDRKIFRK